VNRFIKDISSAQTEQQGRPCARGSVHNWLLPPIGFAKINVDAALSKNSSTNVVAAVARHENGDFLGALVVVMDGVSNLGTLEMLACREGISLATDQ
jgi:hypothetical protein